jgi:hypothetical protein
MKGAKLLFECPLPLPSLIGDFFAIVCRVSAQAAKGNREAESGVRMEP